MIKKDHNHKQIKRKESKEKLSQICRKRGQMDVRYQECTEMTLDCGWLEFVKKDEDRKMKQSRVISFLVELNDAPVGAFFIAFLG